MDSKATEVGGKPSLSITLSDLLGYVVPGATLLVSIAFFEFRASASAGSLSLATPFFTTFRLILTQVATPNLILGVALGVLLLISSYVAGHIVASFSSLLVDRILIFKGYGYPYETLLRLEDDGHTPFSEATASFVRASFFWGVAYLTFRYAEYAFKYLQRPQPAYIFSQLAWLAGLALVAIILSQFSLHGLRTVWRHKEAHAQRGLRLTGNSKLVMSPRIEAEIEETVEHFLSDRVLPRWTRIPELTLTACALPYDLAAKAFADPLNTRRAFNRQFIAQYRILFQRRFRISAEDAATNNFWLAYSYVIDKNPRLAGPVYNWLNLYGFSRNLATSFFLAFLYATGWLIVHAPRAANWTGHTGVLWPLAGIAFLGLSLVLLLRYYFLYVCYFSKFVFRAFVYSELVLLPDGEPPTMP